VEKSTGQFGDTIMDLSKYLTKEENECSVLKNVPIEHLKEVQQKVGTVVKVINHYSSICKTKVRYVFRGPRSKIRDFHTGELKRCLTTRKADAKTVSVYFDIEVTCPGLSRESTKKFHETLKKNFSEII